MGSRPPQHSHWDVRAPALTNHLKVPECVDSFSSLLALCLFFQFLAFIAFAFEIKTTTITKP